MVKSETIPTSSEKRKLDKTLVLVNWEIKRSEAERKRNATKTDEIKRNPKKTNGIDKHIKDKNTGKLRNEIKQIRNEIQRKLTKLISIKHKYYKESKEEEDDDDFSPKLKSPIWAIWGIAVSTNNCNSYKICMALCNRQNTSLQNDVTALC